MLRRVSAILLCVLMLLTLMPTALAVRNAKDEDGVVETPESEKASSREILVTYKKGSANSKKNKIAKDEGLDYLSDIPELNTKVIKLPPGKSLQDIKGLAKKYTEIERVEENFIAYSSEALSPNDPRYISNMKNGYRDFHIEEMWGEVSSVSTVVAVLDTGVYAGHSDFSGRVLTGYDFINNRPGAADDNGHGTRVAGFIAAEGNNGLAIAGVNWGVQILPVKVLGSTGTGTVANIAKGIIYAADQGADIINMSFGTTADSAVLRSAIEYAIDKGCILVGASGNSGIGTVEYPARYSNVIGVGAYSSATGRASFSNYGTGLDIITFGSGITLTKTGSTGAAAGTSFAAPLVAGVLSLMKSVDPSLDNDSALTLVREAAVDYGPAGWDSETGYGYLDFHAFYSTAAGLAGEAADAQPPVITLQGGSSLELALGGIYLEPGYTAIDNIDGDITDQVKIVNSVNTDVAGSYTISYSVVDAAGNKGYATRSVTVLEPAAPILTPTPEPETPIEEPELPGSEPELPGSEPELPGSEPEAPAVVPSISIVGSSTIVLHVGSNYQEQGAIASDALDGDLSGEVRISGRVDAQTAGTYRVTYSVTNSSGLAATATRRVQVIAPVETRERASYRFSEKFNKKKIGTVTRYPFSAAASGDMDLMLTLSGGVVTVIVYNASGSEVSRNQYASGASATYSGFAKGDYTLAVEATQISSNLSYTVNMLMPEVVTVDYQSDEIPLSGIRIIGPWGVAAIVIGILLLAGLAVVLVYKKRRTN